MRDGLEKTGRPVLKFGLCCGCSLEVLLVSTLLVGVLDLEKLARAGQTRRLGMSRGPWEREIGDQYCNILHECRNSSL